MKKLIIYNIRRLLPYSLAATLISMTIGLMNVLLCDISYFDDPGYNMYYRAQFNSQLLVLIIPMTIFAVAMPLLLYGYRFNRRKSDLFLSAPFSESVYRRTVLTIGCLLMITGFTLSYWLCVGVYFIRFATYVPYTFHGMTTILYDADFTWYLPVFFLALLGIAADFFISSFLMGLGQDAVTAILTYTASIFAILLFHESLSSFVYFSFDPESKITFFNTLDASSRVDPISWTLYLSAWFDSLFKRTGFTEMAEVSSNGENAISFFLHYGVGAVCGFLCYFIKERSGEWAGATPMRNYYVRIPFYGLAVAGGLSLSTLFLTNYTLYLYLVLAVSLAYLTIALYARSFKLKKPDILAFIIFGGTFLTFFIVHKIGVSFQPEPTYPEILEEIRVIEIL